MIFNTRTLLSVLYVLFQLGIFLSPIAQAVDILVRAEGSWMDTAPPALLIGVTVDEYAARPRKGEVTDIKPDGFFTQPQYKHVVIRVAEITITEASGYMVPWTLVIGTDVLGSSTLGSRIRAYSKYPGVTAGKIKQATVESIILAHNGEIVSTTINEVIFDIPVGQIKPLRLEVRKKLESKTYRFRRYYFPEADVDWAISQGGVVALTQVQVLAKIQDWTDTE